MSSIVNQENQDQQACFDALLLANSNILPRVLNAAIELDLFGIIAKAGPGAQVSASEIASHLPTTNPDAASMIDRMLRLFASHSLLSYSSRTLKDGKIEVLYGLTPACKFFVVSKEEDTLSSLSSLHFHPATVNVWLRYKDLILEGGDLFKKVHGISVFQYMDNDPAFNTIFNEAMVGLSTIVMNSVLENYKGFEGIKTLVDVGGGHGKTLNMILSKYPSIEGINFDLPHVTQTAPPYPGIQHIGGNMFTSVPKGDAIMIKDTCHNWNNESVTKIFRNIYEALPNNGKLIIITALLPELPETTKASQYISGLDNLMLANPAGRERTAKEFEALARTAGFTNFHVACVAYGIFAVIESYK